MKENSFPPFQYVKGVGPKIAKLLEKLKLCHTADFFYFFPRTYEDRRNIPSLSQLKLNEFQFCMGTLLSVSESTTRQNQSLLKGVVRDHGSMIVAVWFNQPYLKSVLTPGTRVFLKGKVEKNPYTHEIQIMVSDFEKVTEDTVGKITPVYSLVNGLYQTKMRVIAKQVLKDYLPLLRDPFPEEWKKKWELMDLKSAVLHLHFPGNEDDFERARYRIVFEEFFSFQIGLGLRRRPSRKELNMFQLQTTGEKISAYLSSLPYSLTEGQKQAIETIKRDVTGPKRMNRLLQGDVGCGKTDVALMALLFAIESGKKGVILAPTEILAEQHYLRFKGHLDALRIPVFLLKGKMRAKEKKTVIEILRDPSPMIVVGTHALLEDSIVISDLAMTIVDEQHRFGVLQRLELWKKGENSHCLYMTATPIPRSLLLTCFSDLDKTTIHQMPPGRKPVKSYFIREKNSDKVFQFCRSQLKKGAQIYCVYPLVEESEKLDLKSAIEGWETLKNHVFPNYKVGLLHGKLPPNEKTEIMNAFKKKEIAILVATTVIEVGIDVSNATIMIIQHADRFGLSQLHQLRGRIGRGGQDSFCFLIGAPKTEQAKLRIKAMLETANGFQIAEMDLKIRGPGDLLGTRQSGLPEFKVGDMIKDEPILLTAREAAQEILMDGVKNDPVFLEVRNRILQHYKWNQAHDLN